MKNWKVILIKISWVLFSVVTLGCSKLRDWIYFIPEGSHYTVDRRIIKTEGMILFSFKFDEQHRYLNEVNSTHINKLIGLSQFNIKAKDDFGIHKNSARIGWRQIDEDNFEMYAYWYIDGVRGQKSLYTAKIHEELFCEIWTGDGSYLFVINGESKMVDGVKRCKYVAFPYFGGEPTCPHDMYFDIKILN